MNYLPIILPFLAIVTYLIAINQLNKKQIKPSAKLTYISEDLVKVTLYKNNAFSLGFHSYDLFWKKMVDRYTGRYHFFNDKNSYITNCEAQEELEKHIVNNKFII